MHIEERTTLAATSIQLDASGQAPTRIPLFVTGDWKKSVKGDFKVTLDDLKEMKANFEAGVGFPTDDASTGLAIDYRHDYADEAAAWIKGLELAIDPADPTKGIMFANPVEWTPGGQEAIASGRFKCISPMGFFGSKNGKAQLWRNPTNLDESRPNVLEGAGLTNIPFLRGMTPIRADKSGDLHNGYGHVVYVYDEQQKESGMNLDALRVKEREALSVPELDFLAENRDKLSEDEAKKFKLAAAQATGGQVSDEDKQTLAAIKDGTKKLVDNGAEVIEKTRLDALEATANQYREDKVKTVLDKHIVRGAIKQDQADFWKKQLLAADEETRTELEGALEALPSNEALARELGTAEDVAAGSTAREQLDVIAKKKVADAAKDGKTLLYADALKQVYHENDDLRTADVNEQKGAK